MKKSIQLGHHWVPRILERLGAMVSLPTNGILAGQAVSSAILEELGKSTVVYNDIDVFLVADAVKEEELSSRTHVESEAIRLGIPVTALDSYSDLTLSNDKALEILGSTQEGPLNYVWCKRTRAGLSGSGVIYSFDLNAVEVAIDLKTQELYWSRAFEYFLRTHELQVTSMTTPERTLLRYFKKREELSAFGNDTLVLNLVAQWLEVSKTYSMQKKGTGLLTAKFMQLAKKFESRFCERIQLDESQSKLQVLPVLTESTSDYLSEVLTQASSEEELPGLTRMIPRLAYGSTLKRSDELDKALAQDLALYRSPESEEAVRTVVGQSLVWLRHEYLADHRTSTHYALVNRMLERHEGLCSALLGLSLEEQYQCLLDLRKRAKAEGEHIYGWVESEANPADMWNQSHRDAFFKRIEREESHTQLAPPLLPGRRIKGIHIRELLTTRELRTEGSQMSHCVGGYGPKLECGGYRILSIRGAEPRTTWSTAEIAVNVKSKHIRVLQHRGVGNGTADADNCVVLNAYLKGEAKRMGFSFKKTMDKTMDNEMDVDWPIPF